MILHLHAHTSVGEELGRNVQAVCPHCGEKVEHVAHSLLSSLSGFDLPASEVLLCPLCGGASIREGRLKRTINVLFVAPMALIALLGLGTGLAALPLAYVHDALDGGTYLIAACLAIPSFLLLRTMLRFLARNARAGTLTPLGPGLATEL